MYPGEVVPLTQVPGQNIRDLDLSSIRTVLWTNAGAGYSYSSPAPHIASIVLRHVTGMELRDYIKTQVPGVPVYDNYAKMLDEKKPEVVWSFVENDRHLEVTKACAARKITWVRASTRKFERMGRRGFGEEIASSSAGARETGSSFSFPSSECL